MKYYWSRPRFPDLVEEDKRVFVSYDGVLYFSALEQIDQGNYSCTVQGEGTVSSMGRNGPVFPLTVNPSCKLFCQMKLFACIILSFVRR